MLNKVKKSFVTMAALGTLMIADISFANCNLQSTTIFNQALKSDGHLQKEEIFALREAAHSNHKTDFSSKMKRLRYIINGALIVIG